MRHTTLGRTGLDVSVIGIGTWQFGGDWGKDFDQVEVDAMFRRASELGINLVDTAECYGRDHLSERLVGQALKGHRDDWVIASKFGHISDSTGHRAAFSPAEVQAQLEASLRALQVERIDILQFHSGGNEVFDNPELWTMLQAQVAAGKIGHLGISIGASDNLHQTQAAGQVGAAVMQIRYNRLERSAEAAVLPECQRQDLGVFARVPLASGFLSGKYRPGARWEQGDVRHRRDAEQTDETLREVERIRREELPEGVDMAAWALAWCLSHPAVHCVIPGCKSVEQVESNAAAAELSLTRA